MHLDSYQDRRMKLVIDSENVFNESPTVCSIISRNRASQKRKPTENWSWRAARAAVGWPKRDELRVPM